MIPERYMVRAVPIGNEPDMIEEGYIIQINGKPHLLIVNGCNDVTDYDLPIPIDPTTIQPVKVKPIEYVKEINGKHYPAHSECPNCKERVDSRYCQHCGQALSWND